MTDAQFSISVGLPSLLILVGMITHNLRLNDVRDLLRAEIRAGIAELRAEHKAEVAELRAEIAALRQHMDRNHAEVLSRISQLEARVSRLERAA